MLGVGRGEGGGSPPIKGPPLDCFNISEKAKGLPFVFFAIGRNPRAPPFHCFNIAQNDPKLAQRSPKMPILITAYPKLLIFGKIMSISDDLMWRWFELLSFMSEEEINSLKKEMQDGKNPRDINSKIIEIVKSSLKLRIAKIKEIIKDQR